MSRIEDRVSSIVASQLPEFLRYTDYSAPISKTASTTSGSKIVTVADTTDLVAGDRLSYVSLPGNIFVKKILNAKTIEVNTALSVSLSSVNINFIREINFSNFVKFIQAYYKFIEQDQSPQEILQNYAQYSDIENTIDPLVENFFKMYGDDMPRNVLVDKRTFIKHIRDIYKTKGTEEAYKALFRVMFNTEVSIFYPEGIVLKPSDGVWKRDVTIRVEQVDGYNPFDFVNTKITGSISGATAVVNSVIKVNTNDSDVYELLLENIKGGFIKEPITARKLIAAPSTFEIVSANTVTMLTSVDIIDGAAGYTLDSEIVVNYSNVAISSVSETGKIQSIRVINPSRYYGEISTNYPIAVSSPTGSIAGAVTITSNVGTFVSIVPHGLVKNKTANILFYGNTGSYLNDSQNTITVTTVLDSKRFRFNISGSSIIDDTSLSGNVIYTEKPNLIANISVMRTSEGYWLNNKGKLSETVYIHGPSPDSPDPTKIYYQPFSYVVRSETSIAEWRDVAKNAIHPAGTELFGEVYIVNNINANVATTIEPEVMDYLGMTADYGLPFFDASKNVFYKTGYGNITLKADHVISVFGYL